MRRHLYRLLLVLAVAGFTAMACQPRRGAAPAPAAPGETAAYNERAIASFYQGKTVRIIVGLAPGGGFDTYARAIARHLGKHVPGNPAVIVDNMTGGGSLVAANYVYGASRPDGLTIGHWSGGLILQQILGGEGIEFDARKYRFITVPTPDNIVCAVKKDAGVRQLSDLANVREPVIFGATAPGSATEDVPKLLAAAFGFNVKVVSGYSGTAIIRQAADTGEVHGGCWAWESIKVTWKAAVESGDALIIGQVTPRKLPDLLDVELALDLAKTDDARQLLRAGAIVPYGINRPFTVHPDTPNDRVQALRQAFAAVFKDPEFLEEAEKARLDVDPIPGEEVERLIRELFDTPDAVKARLKAVLVPA
jgi:tripartite-type tricarboxylate transporter receptor subunit TctC